MTAPASGSRPPAPRPPAAAGLTIARWNDNELIFFDHERRESWIVYPPRTAYSFVRRVVAGGTLVERRRWSVAGAVEEHVFSAASGCAAHGLECDGQRAIQAAVDTGFNPFA
jgi:hypothetical protein